jgi:trans-2,3-dihydro-3-hydroxyanthranilate isomerase
MATLDFPTHLVRVFAGPDGQGGNPAPIVLDATGMTSEDMRGLAQAYGHESGFVTRPSPGSRADFRLRFFVPQHEMEMCGHATVGAMWCLRRAGQWDGLGAVIETASGMVRAFVRDAGTENEIIEISQPLAVVQVLDDLQIQNAVVAALNTSALDLLALPLLNSSTSRVKTLVALKSVAALDALAPEFKRVPPLCEAINSTGLYPFAIESIERRIFHARQFPKASGYVEDAATGIAAAALLFGLHRYGLVACDEQTVTIHQGRAMGHPSQIRVRFDLDFSGQPVGCYLGGRVVPAEQQME